MKSGSKDASWLIMIDLDDTLFPNGHLYVEAAIQSALRITRALGPKTPYPNVLFSFQHDLDVVMVKEYGYSVARYAESWTRTYRHFAVSAGIKPDENVELAIVSAATGFTRGPFVLFDGVIEALTALRQDGHELRLVTVGEDRLQNEKIVTTGLGSHFDGVHITQMQKRTQMQALAGSRRERVMMVGDSFRSDIAPAVELGYTAVYVPGDTWTHSLSVRVPEGTYHRIESVRELPELVRHLERIGAINGKIPQ